ncbi:MAG: acylneuraminate cytidylyltransferase family protein [bacterium]|nr:acylneuraminate cytidylyltransferase family protein [bacterium]
MKTLGIIPARGGSKRLQKKNLAPLLGKPLIFYTLKEAKKANLERLVVSTEDPEIASFSASEGVEVIDRPEELSKDETPSILVYQHTLRYLEERGFMPDVVTILQPTSPLRKAKHINQSLEMLMKEGCDAVVSVCLAEKNPYWMVKLEDSRLSFLFPEGKSYSRRQELPDVYLLNGAVYTMRTAIITSGRIWDCDLRGLVMEEEDSIDIDTGLDLLLAEALLAR